MKISILSLGVHGTNENYGAILQILAFQEYLKRLFDGDVEVIDYYGLSTSHLLFLEDETYIRLIKRAKNKTKSIIKTFLKDGLTIRINKHEKFISKYLNLTKAYNYKNINDAEFESDFFIAESDVIWDPSFRKTGFDKAYFLNNKCFQNGKKIVYAASMGDIDFNVEEDKQFKELISKIDYISVRENYAETYIKNTFGMNVESLIDPTLLMDNKFYDGFIKNIGKITIKPYVLVYFPAEINVDVLKCAEEYAKERNLDVIYLCRTKIQGRHVRTEIGIEEFLYYIKNSMAVFCDSFHGICFSIIYKKEFFAFVRKDGKKIIDICDKFKLDNRLIYNCKLPQNLIDYDSVYQIIEEEKRKSYEWLKRILIQ